MFTHLHNWNLLSAIEINFLHLHLLSAKFAEGLFAEHKALGRLTGHARPLDEHDDQTVGIVGGNAVGNAGWNENNTALLNWNIVAVIEDYCPATLDNIENFVLHGMLM